MKALGPRMTLALLPAAAVMLGTVGAAPPAVPMESSLPPHAPDAYETPRGPAFLGAAPAPLASALARGDLHAAAQVVLEPREAVVQLRDGQRYTGFLIERTPERVVLRIAGIDTHFRDEMIDRVIVLPSIHERYLSMRAAIGAEDVDQLLMLVEWLRVREQWDLALHEVDQVLAVQPGHPEARRLRLLISSQKDLAERARKRAEEMRRRNQEAGGEESAPTPRPAPAVRERPVPAHPMPRPLSDFPLLDEQQINLIKVYEIDLADPPRILIDRATITRLITEYGEDPAMPQTREGQQALYRMAPIRVLELMFRARARDLYGEVRVLDHPRAMRQFRDTLHRSWIINSCATTRCHGGTDAGRLMLHNRRPGSDQTLYTNFLILERFVLADGTPLINYDEPARSPLLHMGLPRDISRYPHPEVIPPGGRADTWRPTFRSTTDRRFQDATEWILSMYRPRPDYPVEYIPPSGKSDAPVAAEPVGR